MIAPHLQREYFISGGWVKLNVYLKNVFLDDSGSLWPWSLESSTGLCRTWRPAVVKGNIFKIKNFVFKQERVTQTGSDTSWLNQQPKAFGSEAPPRNRTLVSKDLWSYVIPPTQGLLSVTSFSTVSWGFSGITQAHAHPLILRGLRKYTGSWACLRSAHIVSHLWPVRKSFQKIFFFLTREGCLFECVAPQVRYWLLICVVESNTKWYLSQITSILPKKW